MILLWGGTKFELTPLASCYTDKSSFEANIEADSNDVTERPHDNKPRPYVCTVCEKRFTRKGHLNRYKLKHSTPSMTPETPHPDYLLHYAT